MNNEFIMQGFYWAYSHAHHAEKFRQCQSRDVELKKLRRDLLLSHVLGGGHVGGRLQCADDVRPLASVLVELSSFRDEVRETGADRRREVVVQFGAVEHRAALDAHHALSLQLAAFLGHCGHTLIHLPTYATHTNNVSTTSIYRVVSAPCGGQLPLC